MRGYNKVILMGNLTRDPQLKYLPSQTAVAEFGLAINRKWRTPDGQDREEVCYVECAAFGKTGETINQYLTKGKPVFIEGRLKFDSWEDKQGGGKRSKLSVVVDTFSFIGGPNEGGGRDGGGQGGSAQGGGYDHDPSEAPAPRPQANRPPARPSQAPLRPAPEQPFGDEQQFKEDDIPF